MRVQQDPHDSKPASTSSGRGASKSSGHLEQASVAAQSAPRPGSRIGREPSDGGSRTGNHHFLSPSNLGKQPGKDQFSPGEY